MSDRPTPETDAMAVTCYGESGIENSFGFLAVPIKDCRKLERERDEAREVASGLAEQAKRLRKERDEAREKYFALRDLSNNATELAEKYKRERDELREKYDTLATEYMLEVNKLCNERDEAREEVDYYREKHDLTPMSWNV